MMQICIPGRAVRFASIYEPNARWGRPRFEIVAELDRVDVKPNPDDRQAFGRDVWELFALFGHNGRLAARSAYRPEVECTNGVRVLVSAIEELDAQNIPRDAIFKRSKSTLWTVEVWGRWLPALGSLPWQRPPKLPVYGLGIVKVEIAL